MEVREIRRALTEAGGNKSRAAAGLGISRFALNRKMEKYGIEGGLERGAVGLVTGGRLLYVLLAPVGDHSMARLVRTFFRAALVVACAWLHGEDAAADVVHLKSGGELTGEIVEETSTHVVISTRFGKQRLERSKIARIVKGDTPEQAIKKRLAALDPADAEGRFALYEEAKKARLRKLAEELLSATLAADDQHKGANEGHGVECSTAASYVTPAERDRLEKEARAEEMRAQGLVEFEGRFVTPEEKSKLEKGLVLRDGEWMTEGRGAGEGRLRPRRTAGWIHGRDAHVATVKKEIEDKIGKRLHLVTTDRRRGLHRHRRAGREAGQDPRARLAALHAGVRARGDDLEWFGGKRADVLRVPVPASTTRSFIDYLGRDKGLGIDWAERAKQVVSIYRQYLVGGSRPTYLANRSEADVAPPHDQPARSPAAQTRIASSRACSRRSSTTRTRR